MNTVADFTKDPSLYGTLESAQPEVVIKKVLPPLSFPVTWKSVFAQAIQISETDFFLCAHPDTPLVIYLFEVTSHDGETGHVRHHFRTHVETDDFEVVTSGGKYYIRNSIKPNQIFPRFEIHNSQFFIQIIDFTHWENY